MLSLSTFGVRRRLGRSRPLTFILATALAATVPATVMSGAGAAPQQAVAAEEAPPTLALMAPKAEIRVERYGRRTFMYSGLYVVAGDSPFEVRLHRESYDEPVTGEVVTDGRDIPIPEGMLRSLRKLPSFFRVSVVDASGTAVVHRRMGFCPNQEGVPTRPDAPDRSLYPFGCPRHPFSTGAVLGLQAGWAVFPAIGGWRFKLEPGDYDLTATITPRWRELLDIPLDVARAQLTMHVRRPDCGPDEPCRLTAQSRMAPTSGSTAPDTAALAEPTGDADVPGDRGRPDLRSLPAFGIDVARGRYLRFGATVWNAGPSPLVVTGFRRPDEDVMDAYQYFYDVDGNLLGHTPTGSMEWDDRDKHFHWHFRDFARYRLISADGSKVVRSKKEAFCLANTDDIDYTVPGALWRPFNTDLHTACGDQSSIAVREVLDVGSGDTYAQIRPGQSFRLENLPNGWYFIEVTANPMGNLFETDTTNNTAVRRIRIGGKPGHRRVFVPPVGLVDAR